MGEDGGGGDLAGEGGEGCEGCTEGLGGDDGIEVVAEVGEGETGVCEGFGELLLLAQAGYQQFAIGVG